MDSLYHIAQFVHVLSFAFMSVPLFNLIVVNERAQLGVAFDYNTDRYFENIIRRGAYRCYVFQSTVLISGLLLLVWGPLELAALWSNWILLAKLVLLVILMALLSYVHFGLQPKIEALLATVDGGTNIPPDFAGQLKPYRVTRKRLATFCLFLVITTIILGLQVYEAFSPALN
ncbi:MAG: hypothetical protein V3W14_12460, partial [Candidatus Neomarinimicrobiota bacterium]